MGRKSSLTPEQWVEIERRHLVDGESINSLAAEFGVNESSIRRRIKPNKAESPNEPKPLRQLAQEKVEADKAVRRIAEQIAELPIARQQIVTDLAQRLTNISTHLASAAEYGAATAHRLSAIAHSKVAEIDDAKPLDDQESVTALKGVAVLTKLANESSEIAVNLLRANRDTIEELNKRERDALPPSSTDLSNLSDDELDSLDTIVSKIGGASRTG
jgi:IS30 family transposase